MTDLRYPIGKWERRDTLTPGERATMIAQIAEAPARMRTAFAGLRDEQLDTPYREGGWTVRQVVHHVPDSHLNAYTRCKLALTEEQPTIKPYDEAKWATLADSRETPLETSLTLLEALHDRWTRLLRAMTADDYARTLIHPEMGALTLDAVLGLYAWHGQHHVAHITSLRERMHW
jgi:hypothetical protein